MQRRKRSEIHGVPKAGRAALRKRRGIAVSDAERRRIARDLHDGLSQELAVLALDLKYLATTRGLEEELKQDLGALADRLVEMAKQTRRLSHELHPPRLEILGFTEALKAMCVDLGRFRGLVVDVSIHARVDGFLSSSMAIGLYRIAQEALQNVMHHAHVEQARLQVRSWRGVVWLSIEDDGVGWDPDQVEPGLGLVSMRERAELLDGELRIETSPGGGALVSVTIPVADKT